jgi:two-component system, OmpR family, copper resistance phosphate regulon response regulator CusR
LVGVPRGMKFLIVDDDETLAGFLHDGFSEEGHVVDIALDGVHGEYVASRGDYDAIVLDVMIPGKDGFSVLRSLRAKGVATPVLILTARDTVGDAIAGLDGGADDYLRKPFDFGELLARLRSITRREPTAVRLELRVEDVVFDLATRRVTRNDEEIALTAREGAYLEYFMRNAGLLITRQMLETALWNDEMQATSNVIDVYVRRLRTKLDRNGRPSLLQTVRGAGYRFGLE